MEPPEGTSPLILVVDDSPAILMTFELVLGSSYRVAVAENGLQGYEKAVANPPDLIITDIDMPVMNGTDMIARIRGEPSLKQVPILVTTGAVLTPAVDQALAAGANDCLLKPFSAQDLKDKVESWLKREN